MKRVIASLLVVIMVLSLTACGQEIPKYSLNDIVENFKTNGLEIGEKSEKIFALIGAKDGYSIQLNGEKVELYEYDPDSKEDLTKTSLKTAEEGYIDMVGTKVNVILNGNIVLAGYDDHPDKDKIIELFKNYK